MKLFYFLFLILSSCLLFSCRSDINKNGNFESTNSVVSELNSELGSIENVVIEDLKTDKQINKFLTDLGKQDQFLRKKSAKIEQEFGRNSPESKAHYKAMMELDKLCRIKAKRFLEVHGFPHPDKHGVKSYEAILYVYHHSSNDNVMRHESLPIFYQAYKDEKLDESLFDFYLGRMYDNEFGKRMQVESPFNSADRITKYLEAFKFSTN